MEFYFRQFPRNTARDRVSIPNGMEFYNAKRENKQSNIAFQFPTGWNSTISIWISINNIIAFQFPTGWNSTRAGACVSYYHAVSIPNGMEFYFTRARREGILRIVSIPNGMEFYHTIQHLILAGGAFQFPTGWNSTPLKLVAVFNKYRFNSQRDGILPNDKPTTSKKELFQFPTGWNSTIWSTFLESLATRFNSQRDGILRDTLIILLCGGEFQFPTGWNSTRSYRDCNVLSYGFQFPTGWNSTARILPFF